MARRAGPAPAPGLQRGPIPIEPKHFKAFVTCPFKPVEDEIGAPLLPDVSIPFRVAFLRIGTETMRAGRARA